MMFGGFGGSFGRHVPPSDPPIPPSNLCLACGKQEDEENKLLRCSACKMAHFCDKECQALAWKGKGKSPDKHKLICPELAARNSGDKLPYLVRVIRTRSGAKIENGDAIPKAHPPKTKEEKKLVASQSLNECARDHYLSVVKNLTDEQLAARYPLACIERWGGDAHFDEQDGEAGTVRLEALLAEYEDCSHCGSDGRQFFSFCLNRPVNSDRVQHCEYCHKCFYFRPGCLKGCQHCGMGYYFDEDGDPRALASAAGISVDEAEKKLSESSGMFDDIVIQYAEDSRGCNIPKNADYFTRGLASEGYWGW